MILLGAWSVNDQEHLKTIQTDKLYNFDIFIWGEKKKIQNSVKHFWKSASNVHNWKFRFLSLNILCMRKIIQNEN